jgi:hypothetical protein
MLYPSELQARGVFRDKRKRQMEARSFHGFDSSAKPRWLEEWI